MLPTFWWLISWLLVWMCLCTRRVHMQNFKIFFFFILAFHSPSIQFNRTEEERATVNFDFFPSSSLMMLLLDNWWEWHHAPTIIIYIYNVQSSLFCVRVCTLFFADFHKNEMKIVDVIVCTENYCKKYALHEKTKKK